METIHLLIRPVIHVALSAFEIKTPDHLRQYQVHLRPCKTIRHIVSRFFALGRKLPGLIDIQNSLLPRTFADSHVKWLENVFSVCGELGVCVPRLEPALREVGEGIDEVLGESVGILCWEADAGLISSQMLVSYCFTEGREGLCSHSSGSSARKLLPLVYLPRETQRPDLEGANGALQE